MLENASGERLTPLSPVDGEVVAVNPVWKTAPAQAIPSEDSAGMPVDRIVYRIVPETNKYSDSHRKLC